MRSLLKSGMFYCLMGLLILEIFSRTVVVSNAFASVHNEMDRLNYNVVNRTTAPLAVYLGSSQVQSNVAAREICVLLNLSPDKVLNASVAAAGPREMLHIYKTNEAIFSTARVVYINIDRWMLNKHVHMVERQGPPTWRRSASLKDRLTYPIDISTRADWLLGWFCTTWDQRDTWRSLLASWFKNPWTHHTDRVYDCFGRPVLGYMNEARPLELNEHEAPEVVSAQLQNYVLDEDALQALEVLVSRVRSNGSVPIFLRMPGSEAYTRVVERDYKHTEFVWDVLNRRFPNIKTLDLTDVTFSNAEWYDVYHLTRVGAMRLAVPLSEDLKKRIEQ